MNHKGLSLRILPSCQNQQSNHIKMVTTRAQTVAARIKIKEPANERKQLASVKPKRSPKKYVLLKKKLMKEGNDNKFKKRPARKTLPRPITKIAPVLIKSLTLNPIEAIIASLQSQRILVHRVGDIEYERSVSNTNGNLLYRFSRPDCVGTIETATKCKAPIRHQSEEKLYRSPADLGSEPII
jgi:hypothetical protein